MADKTQEINRRIEALLNTPYHLVTKKDLRDLIEYAKGEESEEPAAGDDSP